MFSKVHPDCSLYQYFIPFSGWIVFHCVYVPLWGAYWRPLGVFPPCSYCEWFCHARVLDSILVVFNFQTSSAACFQLKSDPEGCGWSRQTQYTEFFQERNRDNPAAESAAPPEPLTYDPAAASRMGCQPAHITDANRAAQGFGIRTHTCCTKLGSPEARGTLIGAGQPGDGLGTSPLPSTWGWSTFSLGKARASASRQTAQERESPFQHHTRETMMWNASLGLTTHDPAGYLVT